MEFHPIMMTNLELLYINLPFYPFRHILYVFQVAYAVPQFSFGLCRRSSFFFLISASTFFHISSTVSFTLLFVMSCK
jgi:hypothetical protein